MKSMMARWHALNRDPKTRRKTKSYGIWVEEQAEEMQARIDELGDLVAGLEDVRAKEYAFKQARIDALEEELAPLEGRSVLDTVKYVAHLETALVEKTEQWQFEFSRKEKAEARIDELTAESDADKFRFKLAMKCIDKLEFALRRIESMSFGGDTGPCADDAAEAMQDIATQAIKQLNTINDPVSNRISAIKAGEAEK